MDCIYIRSNKMTLIFSRIGSVAPLLVAQWTLRQSEIPCAPRTRKTREILISSLEAL